MSKPIIQVENLSKKFIIGHQKQESYTALRDVITNGAKNSFQKVGKLLKGKGQQGTGDQTLEEFWALNDISFDIHEGDRVGIIGRNGAGKSTLLKVLSRITEPTKGRVTMRGRVASLLEVGTGFHPELSGRENIFLNGAILGMSRNEIKNRFDEIVAFAEVEKFLDTPVKRYSSGMYVRLAFAVAAHLEPEILIVDEVLAVGDAQFQKKCLGKMEDVSKNQGRTVLFVSHNMGVISQLCRSAIILQQGKMLAFEKVDAAVNNYLSLFNKNSNTYTAEESGKDIFSNYIKKFSTIDQNGLEASDYLFNESILVEFEFVVGKPSSNMLIGISMLDKVQNRVFTVLRKVEEFSSLGDGKYFGKMKLPSSLIAPNSYSFLIALWNSDGVIHDLVENICGVQIHDSGTTLAQFEGVDYGSIIVDVNWM